MLGPKNNGFIRVLGKNKTLLQGVLVTHGFVTRGFATRGFFRGPFGPKPGPKLHPKVHHSRSKSHPFLKRLYRKIN